MFSIQSKGYYVYTHSSGTNVFYVGMGKGIRAFDFKDPSRGIKWQSFVKKNPNFLVSIIKTFENRTDALDFEKQEINRLKPLANTHGIIRYKKVKKYKSSMDTSDAGRLGAIKTNKMLTTETRRKAAAKGWQERDERKKMENFITIKRDKFYYKGVNITGSWMDFFSGLSMEDEKDCVRLFIKAHYKQLKALKETAPKEM